MDTCARFDFLNCCDIGGDLKTDSFYVGFLRLRSPCEDAHRLGARLLHVIAVAAALGGAPVVLAVGLALPLSAWAGQDLREQNLVSQIFDGDVIRNAARAAEFDHQLQPGLGAAPADTGYTKLAAGGTRARAWSMGVSRTDMFRDYDRFSIAAYLPMNGTDAVRKLSGKLFESEDVGSFVSSMRALHLIANRRINTEFIYSTQFSRSSRFDASATYRLNSRTDTGKSDLLIGVYYKATF